MMGENVKKETVDYLPLGSVVILKGGVQKVVCTRKDWSEIRSYILITEIS